MTSRRTSTLRTNASCSISGSRGRGRNGAPAGRGVWVQPGLQQMHVTELWSVARRTAERQALMEIMSAWQLRKADPKQISRVFSVVMERIVGKLRSHPAITLDDMAAPKRQIMVTRPFGRVTGNLTDMHKTVVGTQTRQDRNYGCSAV